MIIELKIDEELFSGMVIGRWVKKTGDVVEKDEIIAEVATDKATITINAPEAGKLETLAREEDAIQLNEVYAKIDTSFKPDTKTPHDPNNIFTAIIGRK